MLRLTQLGNGHARSSVKKVNVEGENPSTEPAGKVLALMAWAELLPTDVALEPTPSRMGGAFPPGPSAAGCLFVTGTHLALVDTKCREIRSHFANRGGHDAAKLGWFTMPMNEVTLLRRLQELGPFASADEARRAFDATLQALRRGLNEDEADWLAVALGPGLSGPLLRESHAGELPPEELFRWVKRYSKTRKGVAVEHAQVVCRALAELLPTADLDRLKRHLPELVPLFSVPEAAPSPDPPERRRPAVPDHTLAGGRPGSMRPLSEAGPSDRALSEAKPARSQTHSIAPMRDVHDDPRPSSARGSSLERERSLASAGQAGRH
jgi:uncharacterized protein (DUF2267 family)